MAPPEGLTVPAGHVLKLQKSLYGLKQSPRNWNELLSATISELGYKQCTWDNCLYYKVDDGQLNLILIYVDDIIVLSNDNNHIRQVVAEI